ncbi:MEDS domain-containing protein [Actinotalea sp. C106]|uniref:MEDS domain-containing protein n=1 Tax=Actinotalea sp. C106 TaxID=2908644 RepID=UPI002027AFF2|nr:MEDS domain-containing protein [Actinotalea sp. C106]
MQRFLTTATGRSPGDHVCWWFRGLEEYAQTAREYIREGLDSRQLVAFTKVTPTGLEHTIVSDVAQVGRPADHGRLVLNDSQVPARRMSPTSAPSEFDRMTRAAVADGYTGLRVLTDVNDLVRTPDGLRQWIRTEHLIDRYAVDHPLTILCGYDVDDVGEQTVAEAARVHPLTRGALSPFLVRAADTRGGLALVGEVDRASAANLWGALMAIGPEIPSRVTLDMSEVEFIDHSSLMAVDRAAHSLDVTVTLVGAKGLTEWLVHTLGLRHVRTDPA